LTFPILVFSSIKLDTIFTAILAALSVTVSSITAAVKVYILAVCNRTKEKKLQVEERVEETEEPSH
jgi:hypothetical protein